MNAIIMLNQIAFLNDREKSARFLDDSYMKAINSAISMIMEDRLDNIKSPKKYSFEQVQRVRDELYTLVSPTVSITPIGDVVVYPTDYNYYLKLQCVIDGITKFSRATSYNESGPLLDNPFKRPAVDKTYFDQNESGFFIYRGGVSFTEALLDYVKNPDIVSIGTEGDKISSGPAVLTIGLVYIVYEEAVYAGATYEEGQTFMASSTALTSGIVILNSLIVNCNLPVKIHQEVCRAAAAIMSGSVDDFYKKQDLKADNKES